MNLVNESLEGAIGSVPRCQACGSERVVKDAWACWNPEYGLWEIEAVHDLEFCHQCSKTTTFNWSRQEIPPNQRIRELNDRFRCSGLGRGSIMLTTGVQERGGEFAAAAIKAVREFDKFSDDNNPWGEHDFGSIDLEGEKVFFKIDYYDPLLEKGSENPANESCTNRVMTVMLASEY